ncbi:hypothetical protein [Kutzneria albida]|uniref:hypothetical protein n=1 Tax=Kutzneria albida TaxID=43357 RepID=UPI00046D85F0|nr:hypothetical protein [Kutzneria albida]
MLGWTRLCQGLPEQAEIRLRHCRELAATADMPADDIAPLVFLEGAWLMEGTGAPDCIPVVGRAVELFARLGPEFRSDRRNFLLMWALGGGIWDDDATGTRIAQLYLDDAQAAGAQWAISWAQWARVLAPLMHERPVEAVQWFRAGLDRRPRSSCASGGARPGVARRVPGRWPPSPGGWRPATPRAAPAKWPKPPRS